MQRKIFITGTDTDVGKTFFTTALIKALQQKKQSVIGLKPVAAGCELEQGELKNQDAIELIAALDSPVDYQTVNPIALKLAIAPHIAAEAQNIELSVQCLQHACVLEQFDEPFILVEGAGGWLVPLNDKQTLADYVVAEMMEVILVVGLKLGCINHALLTQQSINNSGVKLVGWVANHIDPNMQCQQENIETLQTMLDCPLLAELPYIDQVDPVFKASQYVKVELLLK